MLRKLDKKNYIFLLLIVFLILSSTHNSNFKYNNFFNIKKIEVVGLNKTDNIFLENEFTDLVGSNIFTLNKKSFELINSVNQIKSYNIKSSSENLIKYLNEKKIKEVVINYIPVGYERDLISKVKKEFDKHSINITELLEPFYFKAWSYCNKGFFNFKKSFDKFK